MVDLIRIIRLTDSGLPGGAEAVESVGGEQTQTNGQRLSRLDGSRNTASGEDNTGQKSELDAVGLAVGHAVAAQGVESTNGNTSSDRGNGAGADIAPCVGIVVSMMVEIETALRVRLSH